MFIFEELDIQTWPNKQLHTPNNKACIPGQRVRSHTVQIDRERKVWQSVNEREQQVSTSPDYFCPLQSTKRYYKT